MIYKDKINMVQTRLADKWTKRLLEWLPPTEEREDNQRLRRMKYIQNEMEDGRVEEGQRMNWK